MHATPPPAPATEPDVIATLLTAAVQAAPVLQPEVPRIERLLRSLYGGDRVYLRKRPDKEATAEQIRALAATHSKEQIAKLLKVGRSTVYRAVRGHLHRPPPGKPQP